MPANDSRTRTDLSMDQIHYLRKEDSKKVTYIYSIQQLQEMIEDGRITEEDFVGIQVTKEGYGGPRGSSDTKSKNEHVIMPSSPWSIHNPKNGAVV